MKTSNKRTPWFSEDTIPTRVGVYQIKAELPNGVEVNYSHWSGADWSWFSESIEQAMEYRSMELTHTHLFPWRGVVGEPV